MDKTERIPEKSNDTKPRGRFRAMSSLYRIICTAAVIIFSVFAILPAAVTWQANRILRGISEKRNSAEFKLLHAGLFSAHASFICRSSDYGESAAAVCSLYYKPLALIFGKVARIEGRGVSVKAVFRDGKLEIPVARAFAARRASGDRPASFSLGELAGLPVSADAVLISGTVIITDEDGGIQPAAVALPFSAALEAPDPGKDGIVFRVSSDASGLSFSLNGTCNAPEETASVKVKLDCISDRIPYPASKLMPAGLEINAAADAAVSFAGRELKSVNAAADAVISVSGIRLTPHLEIAGDGNEIRAKLDNVRIDVNGTAVSAATKDFSFRPADGSISGEIIASIPGTDPAAIKISGTLPGKITASLDIPELRIPQAGIVISNTAAEASAGAGTAVNAEFSSGPVYVNGSGIAVMSGHFTMNGATGRLDAAASALGLSCCLTSLVDTASPDGPVITNSFLLTGGDLNLNAITNLVPQISGFSAGGKISARADYLISKSRNSGSASFAVSDGFVSNPEKNISVSGIDLDFDLPALPRLASGNQKIVFENLSAGGIRIGHGLAFYRMLNPLEWQISNLEMDWCGGKVRTEALRFAPGKKGYSIVMHCDKINLADLLHQIGMGEDKGNGGFVSGAIPVGISAAGDRIVFRGGYLYSTPGETGHIMLTPSDNVAAAAGGSVETSLAIDSLADFGYSWIRIGMDMDGTSDDLLIRFEMEGKPARKLMYSAGESGIVRSAIPNEFKKITLDTTFRLPVSDTLKLLNSLKKEGL